MSTVLKLEHIEAMANHIKNLPHRVGDHRIVINHDVFKAYQDFSKLTDEQMNSRFLVSDYID